MSEPLTQFPRAEVFALQAQTKFVREPFADIQPRGAEWIVKNLLPAHGYGFIAGPSQGGKSFLSLEWSLRISTGWDVLGHRSRRVGVVYVASEGANGVRKRVAAWRQANTSANSAFELIAQAPDLRDGADVEDLIAELRLAADQLTTRGQTLGLVIIDTLAASMPGGNENDGADMSALLTHVQRIAMETGAFVLIVSHTGKDETRGLRGWSGQFAGADTVVMLSREEGAELRVGVVKKQKDGEDGERFAFRLERVLLGHDPDGDEISSAVVVYEDTPEPKSKRPKALSPAEQVVLQAAKYVIDHGATQNVPPVPGAAAHQRAITRSDVRARALASGFASDDEKANTVNVRFARTLLSLVARAEIRIEGELIWLLSKVTR